MLKKLSYINLVLGLVFFAVLKIQNNMLESIFIIFPIMFNLIAIVLLNHQTFVLKLWHKVMGILGLLYGVFSILVFLILFITSCLNTPFLIGMGLLQLIFGIIVVLQFIKAWQADKKEQPSVKS
ncbi:hypothetical protein [Pedobacter montanisoli]|uniref:DUF308 domain-containing protein n=1 Tax=Pedobacter montanisoli TaxID=2923277 RepID=A0ABS9ZZW5_9SPHI|nr:hypothetical protein [Pedobacter montanisoli]MCJ0743844.1 hypothetical protein [Pedobacter montanisoli]